MKNIKILTACSILITSTSALAVDDAQMKALDAVDPEMDYIDTSPDNRVAPPAGMNKSLLVEVTATVTAVDMKNNTVTIQGPEGHLAFVKVTDQVKNLPQVKIGDRVDITYYQSMAASLVKLDADTKLDTEVTAAKATAAAGEKPAGVIGMQITRRGEVVFVDPYQQFISFRSLDRGLRKVSLKNSPDLQHYLKELKKGDIVEVTYTQAMAISVEPAN
ncbi:MAG: hypothetical protein QNL87_01825 [Gammaproteobacteria bacterium]|nr:hypothetical protein [Gammaproteobacteria bacterium]